MLNAINEHKGSEEYRTAQTAHDYYKKRNPDIARLEKVIYDMKGMAHKDLVSPNHKLRNGYYPAIINQTVSHLLANGVGFSDPEIKNKFGRNFDGILRKMAVDAKNAGVSYGFYNGEKVIHFPFLEFKAIPDDITSAIVAGVRFTQIDENKPLVATLYEPDGYTEYTRYKNEFEITRTKTAYIVNEVSNAVEGVYGVHEGNFSRLPIYPLYNVSHQSEIIGVQEILTAIDMVNSQLVNNVSQGELIYWVLKNYGGNDDIDNANFIINLLKSHVLPIEGDDCEASPHQITVPFEANEAAAVRLKRLLYESMGAVDTETLKAGNLTATAINAAFHDMRLNSANMEYEVIEFIQGICRIAGLSEDVALSFTYFETVNETEAIQNLVIMDSIENETLRRKACEILGMLDDFENIQKEKMSESLSRFSEDYKTEE